MNARALKTLTSSAKQDWSTPQAFFDNLDAGFNFVLDAAASAENAKCQKYLDESCDAFEVDWRREAGPGTVWLNPPYGRELPKWIDKAVLESRKGATVVVLVPSRTDTKWFRRAWDAAVEVLFVPGRLKFGGCKDAAPFPSVVFVLRAGQGERRVGFLE